MDGGADDAGLDGGCFLPPPNECGDARCVTTVAGRGASRQFSAVVYQPSRNSLIISEPHRQQVIEFSIDDGGTRVLAGAGVCGQPTVDGLCFPTALALDSDGALYIADPGNDLIRKLESGLLSTFLASPQIEQAHGMAVVGGRLFVANGSNLLRIDLASQGVDVLFRGYELGAIGGVAASLDGGLLFAAEHTVRSMAVTSDGGHTLLSGQPGNQTPGYLEGPPASARFGYVSGLAELADGLYLADGTNHRLRVLAASTLTSSTLAGTGRTGISQGAPLETSLVYPGAITTNGVDLFIISSPGYVYRYSPQSSSINAVLGGRVWVTEGCARDVDLPWLSGLTRDDSGNVYFSDGLFHSLRVLTPRGDVRTLVGGVPGFVDGPADAGRIASPSDLAWRARAGSPLGELVVTDQGNGLIRAFDLSRREIRTLVGTARTAGNPEAYGCSAAFGPALSSARLCRPAALALGAARAIFVADSNLVATEGRISLYQPGLDSLSLFNQDFVPGALAVAPDGGLWVTSTSRSLSRIERLDENGNLVSTLDFSSRCPADPAGFGVCRPSSLCSNGPQLFVTVGEAGLVGQMMGDAFAPMAGIPWQRGHRDGPGRSALFRWPDELVDDGDGGLYVADEGNESIRYIAP